VKLASVPVFGTIFWSFALPSGSRDEYSARSLVNGGARDRGASRKEISTGPASVRASDRGLSPLGAKPVSRTRPIGVRPVRSGYGVV
jgi:hypothetical protein